MGLFNFRGLCLATFVLLLFSLQLLMSVGPWLEGRSRYPGFHYTEYYAVGLSLFSRLGGIKQKFLGEVIAENIISNKLSGPEIRYQIRELSRIAYGLEVVGEYGLSNKAAREIHVAQGVLSMLGRCGKF